ncbi:MAG: HD domain-containing protein [Deltaproteobacteria bacterium]|nr:HD domain-containing protein [Deltaproteobacteria bacterium]MDL1960867.1 HD domain-containing protein [Deltaproteobacteria bacterium]
MNKAVLVISLSFWHSDKMELLDRESCLALLQRYQVPGHIVSHSLRVAQVGVFIAAHLKMVGEDLDIGLVEAGGLLHDITKMDSVHTKQDHALSAFRLLETLGYHAVADIARQHVRLDWNIRHNPIITEALLVNYADKRVKHTSIVTLSERFEDLLRRYGTTPERREMIRKLLDEVVKIEPFIFTRLDIGPARLNELNCLDPVARANVKGIYG